MAQQQYVDFIKSAGPLQIGEILNRISNWLFGLLILLAGLFIMWAAYKYLTAGADPESAKEAKKIIIYAIIAIVIAALSKGMVYIVLQLIGAPTP